MSRTIRWCSALAACLCVLGAAGCSAQFSASGDAQLSPSGDALSLSGSNVKTTLKFDVVVSQLPTKACTQDGECASLDDGDLCNGVWSCQSGMCHPKPNSGVVCDSGYDTQCNVNTCSAATGTCAMVATGDGGTCAASGCAAPGTCHSGLCKPGAARSCATGYGCNGKSGECEVPQGHCTDAMLIDAYPFVITGSTVDMQDTNPCPGGAIRRGPADRHVYRLRARAGVSYSISLGNTAGAGFIAYEVIPDTTLRCTDANSCVNSGQVLTSRIMSPMSADGDIEIEVVRQSVASHPAYTLTVDQVCGATNLCPPEGQKPCGYDECGHLCGTCAAGSYCAENRCRVAGDVCENPLPLGESADSWGGTLLTAAVHDYFVTSSHGTCQVDRLDFPAHVTGASDTVFSFTPPETGGYRIRAVGASIWVSDRCNGIDCLMEGQPGEAVGNQESSANIALTLTGGKSYRIGANVVSVKANRKVSVCQQDCDNKAACADDGCDGVCETCPGGLPCSGHSCCVPDCDGSKCGADGCGGKCACGAGDTCKANGTCCTPSCDGKQCGPDGCGGVCGSCGSDSNCSEDTGLCCVPNCTGKECGGNGCNHQCGTCADDSKCLYSQGKCCIPNCTGKECGDNGCGHSCGECANNRPCEAGGTCCVPKCAGKVCGDDGCGGKCGPVCTNCAPDQTSCCDAQCTGKVCGSDACGKSCGSCPDGKVCSADQKACVTPPGDTCANALAVGTLPFTGTGSTAGMLGDYSAVLCQFGGLWGKGSRDQVWAFDPPATGEYAISLTTDFDAAVYVVDDCSAMPPKCQAGTILPMGTSVEPLVVKLTSGKTWHIIVDGIDNAPPGAAGTYTLKIAKTCTANCNCGNGKCDVGEDSTGCPQDCLSAVPDAGSTDGGSPDAGGLPDAGSAPDGVADVPAAALEVNEYANWPLPPDSPPQSNFDVATNTVTDKTTGLVWQRALPGQTYDRAGAVAYCDGLTLEASSDWRLPSRIELLSIVDAAKVAPALDTTLFPGVPPGGAFSPVWFWTASVNVQSPDANGWCVDFATGAAGWGKFADSDYVRCVRGGKAGPATRYTMKSDVAIDNATGLVWQLGPSATKSTKTAAATACAALKIGGYTAGWRLPTKKEFESLVDPASFAPAVSLDLLPVADSVAWYWISTSIPGWPNSAWILGMGWGGAIWGDGTKNTMAAWCVHAP